MIDIQPFLTAYDPSDLPGGSIDPLGFDRGYDLLAEKILPGLTNVANRPRYFSAMCSAIVIAEQSGANAASDRDRLAQRMAAIQQLERLWTLSCVLASQSDPPIDAGGIRGLRYIEQHIPRIRTSSDGNFRLLSRQVAYGMVGIYGSIADRLKLIARDRLDLSEPGRSLGEAFISETKMPDEVRAAVMRPRAVGRETLREWGTRAHPNVAYGEHEARLLIETVELDDVRRRMCAHLRRFPSMGDDPEVSRLRRILAHLERSGEDPDLRESLLAIAQFEEAYGWLLLTFFRLLWFCQADEPYCVSLEDAGRDPVIGSALDSTRKLASSFDAAFARTQTARFQEGLERIREIRNFVAAAGEAKSGVELVTVALARHKAVQQSKLAGGRPKMPWIELEGVVIKPTLTTAQRLSTEPTSPAAVLPHPFRTGAADRFYFAPGGVA